MNVYVNKGMFYKIYFSELVFIKILVYIYLMIKFILSILFYMNKMVYIRLYAVFLFYQVRVNLLVCLGKILEYLDKWFVFDDILFFLQQIFFKEFVVFMGILGS